MINENELEAVWGQCLSHIEARLPEQTFYTWLKPLRLMRIDGQMATIQTPNRFVTDWIGERYDNLIDEALRNVMGRQLSHRFLVGANGSTMPQVSEKANSSVQTPTAHLAPDNGNTMRPVSQARARAQLNPGFIFSSFVVGDSNRLAHAASIAVAEKPARTRYNPLFIYGPVGMGKTHLAQAIGNDLVDHRPDSRVLYVTSETFTNDFINSLAQKKAAAFTAHYRSVDILLIDDIQFLAGKESTQEQFFHTFNTLHQNGKQIVLTADRPPNDISGLEERLLSRFQWGLAADIHPPDFETRVAILRRKIELEGGQLPPDVIEFIAKHISSSIRHLEGALVRLLAVDAIDPRSMTVERAQDILRDSLTNARKPITMASIRSVVARLFDVSEALLLSKRRTQNIAIARQVAMYLARTLTGMSLKMIGRELGGRDHSTVIHAVNVVRDSMKTDQEFKHRVDEIISTLYGQAA